jgi:hypothetical protein
VREAAQRFALGVQVADVRLHGVGLRGEAVALRFSGELVGDAGAQALEVRRAEVAGRVVPFDLRKLRGLLWGLPRRSGGLRLHFVKAVPEVGMDVGAGAVVVRAGRPIREVVFDPMRFSSKGAALRARPRPDPRGVGAVRDAHDRLLRTPSRPRGRTAPPPPGDPELDRHAANVVAKPTPRGWRPVKNAEAAQIDALIALAISAVRTAQPIYVARGSSGSRDREPTQSNVNQCASP